MSAIVEYLFQTRALQVAASDQPFWYTSGLFGPYYVNTHYLIGSAEIARDLLAVIDEAASDESVAGREVFPEIVFRFIQAVYAENKIYQAIMQHAVQATADCRFDFISGGERRDFFFSNQLAVLTQRPHISIFKNGDMVYTDAKQQKSLLIYRGNGQDADISDEAKALRQTLAGQVSLHVADLVTQASSYIRAWIPAIETLGAKLNDTLSIVDRDQGGREALAEAGVNLVALAQISDDLFVAAHNQDLIDADQLELVRSYAQGPEQFIRDFINKHPNFLDNERGKDEKTAERVRRLEAMEILE